MRSCTAGSRSPRARRPWSRPGHWRARRCAPGARAPGRPSRQEHPMRPAETSPAGQVVVVGGGLAGLTAAIALREAGRPVTLLEARPRLGGATSSFSRGGLIVDNGQHVFLGCCTAYRELIARLGMTGSVSLQDRFDVTVLSPRGQARLRRTRLPGPLHMGQALAT